MTERILPRSPIAFAKRLKYLHQQRKKLRHPERRLALSRGERNTVLAKTAARCHLCGGKIIASTFAADHVLAHAAGGPHALDNYLPAHGSCNGCRWFYSPEEFQWILRIGIWGRKQMEDGTRVGRAILDSFWKHEKKTGGRRKRTL